MLALIFLAAMATERQSTYNDDVYINNIFINEEKRPENDPWYRVSRRAPTAPRLDVEGKMFSEMLDINMLDSSKISTDTAISRLSAIINRAASTNIAARMAISQTRKSSHAIREAIAKKYAVSDAELEQDDIAFKLPCWARSANHWAYRSR
jgi:hypothetical protein